jgi:hypothetical protein
MRFLSKVTFFGVLRGLGPVQYWVITRIFQLPFARSSITGLDIRYALNTGSGADIDLSHLQLFRNTHEKG